MATRRLDRRQGFLISATVHLLILTLLAKGVEKTANSQLTKPSAGATEPPRHVLLVSPRMARQLLQRAPVPPPPATPPPRVGRDRISVGAPSTERAKQLVL